MTTFCHGRQIDPENDRGQAGFTLVELLIAIITVGILAAIALPAFAGQRQKANDAEARVLVADAAKAMQTYATTHDSYAATPEDVLEGAPGLRDAPNWNLEASATGFTISVTSSSGQTFSIGRSLAGAAARTCTTPGAGGCPKSGTW